MAITVMVFALFVVFAIGLTVAAKSYYDKAVRNYTNEQAYLTAKSIVESLCADQSALTSFMNSSTGQLGLKQTIMLNDEQQDDGQTGSAYAVVSYDSASQTYSLAVTATYGQTSQTFTAVLNHQTASSAVPGLYYVSSANYLQSQINGAVTGSSANPGDVYIKCSYITYDSAQMMVGCGSLDTYPDQIIHGNLIMEFEQGTVSRNTDTAQISGLRVDGDVYIVSAVTDSDTDHSGLDIIIENSVISGHVYYYGKLHSSSVTGSEMDYPTPVQLASKDSIPFSAGIKKVTVPAEYTQVVNEYSDSLGVHYTAETGTINFFATNRNLVFDVPAGQTHTYVIDCSGKNIINASWLVQGGGKVVLYLINADKLFFNIQSNRSLGGVISDGVISYPASPQMEIYTNSTVTYNVNNNGKIRANLYGSGITLNVTGKTNSGFAVAGGFIGKTLNVSTLWSSNALKSLHFQAFVPAFDAGSGAVSSNWQVDHYE